MQEKFDKLKEEAREMLTGSTVENDLRARLHADHAEVARLIDELLASGEHEIDLREDLRDQIVVNLGSHAHAEEEVVYDYLAGQPAMQGKVEHGIREHFEIEQIMNRVATCDCADPTLTDLVKSLKDAVSHHVHDEENTLLPAAERDLGRETLVTLISPFNARKQALYSEMQRTQRRRSSATDDVELGDIDVDPTVRSPRGLEDSTSHF